MGSLCLFTHQRALKMGRSNFCKDHRDKIDVPDPLVVEDLINQR